MSEMLLLIEDMFLIKDRGFVATGMVAGSPICVGDRVWVPTASADLRFQIVEIQSESSRLEKAEIGEQIGVLLNGESAELLQRGRVLCRDA